MARIKCVRCGITLGNDGCHCFYPISPYGTKDREWVCDKCLTPEEHAKLVIISNARRNK